MVALIYEIIFEYVYTVAKASPATDCEPPLKSDVPRNLSQKRGKKMSFQTCEMFRTNLENQLSERNREQQVAGWYPRKTVHILTKRDTLLAFFRKGCNYSIWTVVKKPASSEIERARGPNTRKTMHVDTGQTSVRLFVFGNSKNHPNKRLRIRQDTNFHKQVKEQEAGRWNQLKTRGKRRFGQILEVYLILFWEFHKYIYIYIYILFFQH